MSDSGDDGPVPTTPVIEFCTPPSENTPLGSSMQQRKGCGFQRSASVPSLVSLCTMERCQDTEVKVGRQLARKTLNVVGETAKGLINKTVNSNKLFNFGMKTFNFMMRPATNFAQRKWNDYGDTLLDKLDAKIDEAFDAVEKQLQEQEAKKQSENQLTRSQTNARVYQLYWSQLKHKFINSQWYAKVDDILMQNVLVKVVADEMKTKLYRPGEMFYNTVTDEFMKHENVNDFLAGIKERMGPVWDDRLGPLARAFYVTARTVSVTVGAGKFLGGALQLGRAKLNQKFNDAINATINDLLDRWDRVLGFADGAVDRLLPDRSKSNNPAQIEAAPISSYPSFSSLSSRCSSTTQLSSSSSHRHHDHLDTDDEYDIDMDDDGLDDYGSLDSSYLDSMPSSVLTCSHGWDDADDEADDDADEDHAAADEKWGVEKHSSSFCSSSSYIGMKRCSADQIASKINKRLRQRLTNLGDIANELKERLSTPWFTNVDEILMQNPLIRVMASYVKPSQYFFNTALETLQDHTQKQDFLEALPCKLGASWDERLCAHSESFYREAKEITSSTCDGRDGNGCSSTSDSMSPSSYSLETRCNPE